MQVKTFISNPIQENTFLLFDETKECIIVDPGFIEKSEFEILTSYIKEHELRPVKIINTHCHFDHILGVDFCREEYSINWYAHKDDAFLVENAPMQASMFGVSVSPINLPDEFIDEGDLVEFGSTSLKLFHVPGHSPGSLCFYEPQSGNLITGDVLFKGSIGRTDLPGGDMDTLLGGIKSKLFKLPENVIAFPGHGPETTIGYEKLNNPFLQ